MPTPGRTPWTSLPHPTPAQRAARRAGRRAAALVLRYGLSHMVTIVTSVQGPTGDTAMRAWWSSGGRRALLPLGVLLLGDGRRHVLFCPAPPPPPDALEESIQRVLAAAVPGLFGWEAAGTGAVVCRVIAPPMAPMSPPMAAGRTPAAPAAAAAREARRLLASTAAPGSRPSGAHRYLVAGTHRPRGRGRSG